MRFILLMMISLTLLFASDTLPRKTIHIGILSFRPIPDNQRIWLPLEQHLHSFAPQFDFNITSYTQADLEKHIGEEKIDFAVLHPDALVAMEVKYGVSNIASVVRLSTTTKEPLTQYGGVIAVLSSRSDIRTLQDAKGKTIATSHSNGFAVMVGQQEVFSKVGIDILRDCRMIYTGQPMDKVLKALRSHKADVGFFRTGYIEEMLANGKLKSGELTIINSRKHDHFPYWHSTDLYPEWGVIATSKPSPEIVKSMIAALYSIHIPNNPEYTAFNTPNSYKSVRLIMQKHHAYPFDRITFNYRDIIHEYALHLILLFSAIILAGTSFTFYYILSSRRNAEHTRELETILSTASDGIHVHDLDGNLYQFSDSFASMLGYTREEMEQLSLYDWDHHFTPEYIRKVMNNLVDEVITFETKHTRKDGSIIDVEINARGLFLNKVRYIYASSRDITERKHAEEKILESKLLFDRLAHHDPLTELPNRLSLIETLIIKTDKMEEHPFALFYVDLDGFKEINDSYGHRFGDKLLIHVALLLEKIFPKDSFIVRTGGDEFVILLSCQKDQNLIHQTMQMMVDILNHPINIDDIDVYITASVGIAMYPNDAKTTEELLQHADAAMYNAKKMGKNTYSFYHTDLTEKALQRTTIATNLKKALHNSELTLYFQPQINPQDNSIIGAEALLRWFTPEGSIPPFTFIPIAEETGLILDIGKWVLEESFLTAKKWNESYGFQGRIAVNVSARQLIHPDFLMVTRELIEKTKCNPSLIELEITESSILENPQRIIQLLKVLKEDGFHLSIDDFGTGYSSLSYLKNLPIDKLKIDISFVRNITMEPKNQTIVKTIIALANGLGMEVLAEGVETAEELQFLRLSHIDSIQGYYYHKPMSTENIELLFTAGN